MKSTVVALLGSFALASGAFAGSYKPSYTPPPPKPYSPPARSYSPPARTYSPPPRTYSPPASTRQQETKRRTGR